MPDGARGGVTEGHQRVTLARESDVNRWCARFHCTEAQLQRAVKAVGHDATRVHAHIRKKYGARPS